MPRTKFNQYDHVFLGMGLASLSLLMRMLRSGKFSGQRILLIDREPKTKNDRTWCFWEKETGFFEEIVYQRWPHISFLSDEYSAGLAISPYEYKMIRGIDLYNYCYKEIDKHENVELLYTSIDNWSWQANQQLTIRSGNETLELEAAMVFNSIYVPNGAKDPIRLLQHFKGWMIETEEPFFDRNKAIMMDFRVHQDHGTSFAYVLPVNEKQALVEYTLFTKELLAQQTYEEELKDYIGRILKIKQYRVIENEFGIIPMTSEKFRFRDKAYNIGTAGGQTKGSSGYTFQFIQKNADQIVEKLLSGASLDSLKGVPARFRFYDNVLLHILYHETLPGKKIFSTLFKKNAASQVLKFLDNESTLMEELKIISTLPTMPFLKAAIRESLGIRD